MITIHDELLQYKGNFKSNNKKRLHPDADVDSEKMDALNGLNPEISGTNEIITGTVGSATGVKALRRSFTNLLEECTDSHFTGRLMKLVTKIYMMNKDGIPGKKSVLFSAYKPILGCIVLHIREKGFDMLHDQFVCSHSSSRVQATASVKELNIKSQLMPRGDTHYRILHHLSIISDYEYVEINHRFEPLSQKNALNAFAYSQYVPVGMPLTEEIMVSLPVIEDLSSNDSVIECLGILYYQCSGPVDYVVMRGAAWLSRMCFRIDTSIGTGSRE